MFVATSMKSGRSDSDSGSTQDVRGQDRRKKLGLKGPGGTRIIVNPPQDSSSAQHDNNAWARDIRSGGDADLRDSHQQVSKVAPKTGGANLFVSESFTRDRVYLKQARSYSSASE